MIEGLRHLPWFYEALRRSPDEMALLGDCSECKRTRPRAARVSMGCGYEPAPASGTPVIVWTHEGWKHEPATICPGYSCRLPEVLEIARARLHWDKGQLGTFCEGQPSELIMIGIEILEGSASELERALLTPRSKGGLAEG